MSCGAAADVGFLQLARSAVADDCVEIGERVVQGVVGACALGGPGCTGYRTPPPPE